MTRSDAGAGMFEIDGVSVRVISNCPTDISATVAAERRVIGKLRARDAWRHETVSLFVLDDLAPLQSHLRERGQAMDAAALQLPGRPMVNVYDPRHPVECFVFVNRQMMIAEGYWDDPRATEGLLAHEHAHPLSEARATMAARGLSVEAEGPEALAPLAAQLGRTLSTGAVTELLANTFCIANGFADELAHVDRIALARAAANLPQRAELERRVTQAIGAGRLPAVQAGPMLLLADAQIGLPFALEIVPFAIAGRAAEAEALEARLVGGILSAMGPRLVSLYAALRTAYGRLEPAWDAAAVRAWCAAILALLSEHLSAGGAGPQLRLSPAAPLTGDRP